MMTIPSRTLIALILLVLAAPLAARSSEDAALESLLEREWERLMAAQPVLAIYLGRKSELDWPDNTHPAREAAYRHHGEVLKELQAIDDEALSPAKRIDLRLFQQQLNWQRAGHEHGLDLFIMNQSDGLHTLATLADSIDFRTLSDYRDWVRRLEGFGRYTDREIAVLEEAIVEERVHPAVIVDRMVEAVSRQPELHRNPEESPFFRPFLEAPDGLKGGDDFRALESRARVAIAEQVGPAFERLSTFLAGPYREAAPVEVGLGRLPGGEEAYRFLIERYTTTQLGASEIHQIGLREVARIRAEMEAIKEQVGFEGSLESFFEHLRSDPRHYVDDPEELLRRYRAFCKKVDGQMPRLFNTLPRKPYGVEPIPDYIAPSTTTAYYLPGAGHLAGTYCVNLYRPETRALFEIPALSLHESVPGHHHQIALAQELPSLPAFRRDSAGFGDYTVFVEGWALYAESLGEEMGLYDDPYDRFGRLTYDIWRAIRLVVDTGIHHQGWSRRQAVDYFLANSPRSRLDVTNEVDRYISWPGQALAYKMGELAIWEQRRRAEQRLGERFDLRSFHDALLKQGAVPVSEMERQVSEYIAERLSAP